MFRSWEVYQEDFSACTSLSFLFLTRGGGVITATTAALIAYLTTFNVGKFKLFSDAISVFFRYYYRCQGGYVSYLLEKTWGFDDRLICNLVSLLPKYILCYGCRSQYVGKMTCLFSVALFRCKWRHGVASLWLVYSHVNHQRLSRKKDCVRSALWQKPSRDHPVETWVDILPCLSNPTLGLPSCQFAK